MAGSEIPERPTIEAKIPITVRFDEIDPDSLPGSFAGLIDCGGISRIRFGNGPERLIDLIALPAPLSELPGPLSELPDPGSDTHPQQPILVTSLMRVPNRRFESGPRFCSDQHTGRLGALLTDADTDPADTDPADTDPADTDPADTDADRFSPLGTTSDEIEQLEMTKENVMRLWVRPLIEAVNGLTPDASGVQASGAQESEADEPHIRFGPNTLLITGWKTVREPDLIGSWREKLGIGREFEEPFERWWWDVVRIVPQTELHGTKIGGVALHLQHPGNFPGWKLMFQLDHTVCGNRLGDGGRVQYFKKGDSVFASMTCS